MEPFARISGRYEDAALRAAIDRAVGKRRHSTRIANLGTFTGYRIGLDVGNGNIGWCVLFEDDLRLRFLTAEDIRAHNAALPPDKTRTQLPDLVSFVPLGTHKFEARENAQKGEKSFSKIKAENRARTGLLDARQNRKLHVREALEDAGLIPQIGAKPEGHSKLSADKLRAKLLEPDFIPSHPHDLGRALYAVLKRRGWMKPVGRGGVDETSDFGDEATRAYREVLRRFECDTVGRFLERCAEDAKRDKRIIRKRHKPLAWQKQNKQQRPKDPATARSYEALCFLTPTFELIWDEARLLRDRHKENVKIRDETWARIEEAAEFRRPLKAKTPGPCEFLRDRNEPRCVRALPSFQRFRILQQAANLRDPHRKELDRTRFREAVAILEQTEKISVRELARALGAQSLRLTDDKGEDTAQRMLAGAKTDLALRDALGNTWAQLPIEARDQWTMRFLRRHEDPRQEKPWEPADEKALEHDAEAAFGPNALAKVDKVATAFEDKFASLSLKAASKLAEGYENGLSYDERLAALGAPEPEHALYDELPYYGSIMPDIVVPAKGFAPASRTCVDEREHGRAANPDVHVVINRIRAVVNAIIGMMGGILPTTCVVEMARSAFSEEEANRHSARTLARQQYREDILADIGKLYEGRRLPIGPALDRLVDRWKAATRQGWRDYDGNPIARSALVDPVQYQLDHVRPAAFGDFRQNNLFVSRYNGAKGRKLPWEAFGGDPEFQPALLAFAIFGLEQRIKVLSAALNPKPPRRPPDKKKRARLTESLTRAEDELARIRELGTPRPDVFAALQRTLTSRPESLVTGADGGDDQPRARSAARPFTAGDQASLFFRFAQEAHESEPEFAARDVANIGWSTKLARRYLRHLGADSEVIKPWAVHALRCMFGLNKERADLRNHAVDAFLIGHFDRRVLIPAFARLRDIRLEELYATRALRLALSEFTKAPGFFDELERNVVRLADVLPKIATAHRADNMWNPGDADGGSFGALGGQNVYGFRPNNAERERLTKIAARYGKVPADGRVLTRTELLALVSGEAKSANDLKLRKELNKAIKLRYRGIKKPLSLKTALPLPDQPGAFIDASGKFAIVGASPAGERRVIAAWQFSRINAAARAAVFTDGQPIYRRGDTVIVQQKACVVTKFEADGRLGAFPVDTASREEKYNDRPTIPANNTEPTIQKFASDVLGRRLHRLRKTAGGLEPVPYPLRDK